MKNRLVYENLDTSFVNLSALVRFLRARNFVGDVSVELGEYTGEIVFSAENAMRARERDRVSGRVAEGEQALQRLLIRAREPGGKIHVHQTASETTNAAAASENVAAESPIIEVGETILPDVQKSNPSSAGIFQQSFSLPQTPRFAENHIAAVKNFEGAADNHSFAEKTSHPKTPEFPFEFTNQVEAKAKQQQLSETDWCTLLQLVEELLRTINDSLAKNNLNFAAAFQKSARRNRRRLSVSRSERGNFRLSKRRSRNARTG